ncbi:hypothetical protein IN07_13880 [Modestobacter caceresii]|uniref:Uncharacterized protein n=1 Tax=Modestobacter caceresii TaxID=1522368 RepID=A0A098Y6F0_9ACTN|nr:hypothetical protein IN07_13880 [Modestobacter caceresii]
MPVATANPTAMVNSPAATTSFVPTARIATIASGAVTPMTVAKGRVATPAVRVSYPRTDWKYWVIMKMNPNRLKKASAVAPLPTDTRGSRNSRTSSSGSAVRSSCTTKPASTSAATA